MTPNGLFDSQALLALNRLLLKMTPSIDAASVIYVHCAGNLPPCLSQYSDWGSPQSQIDSQSIFLTTKFYQINTILILFIKIYKENNT